VRPFKRKSDCPIHFAIERFGDAWTLLIIRDLMFFGRSTYGEFLYAGEGIATNILADRLERLEVGGIVSKGPDPERPSRSRYALTRQGIDLLPIMLDMIAWSGEYDPGTAVPPQFVERLKTDRVAVEAEIRERLVSSGQFLIAPDAP